MARLVSLDCTIPNSPVVPVAVKQLLAQVNKSYSEAFARGNSSLFMHCYAPNACMMPSNAPVIIGEKGLMTFYQLGYRAGIGKVTLCTGYPHIQSTLYYTVKKEPQSPRFFKQNSLSNILNLLAVDETPE